VNGSLKQGTRKQFSLTRASLPALPQVNKRRVGQSLTTRTYCLSMLTSCGHILMEVWKFDWSDWRGALKRAVDLRFDAVQRSMRRSIALPEAQRNGFHA
jgi:hypothetical protein